MREVVIQIPTLETKQNIEIDVKINGRKRNIKYRWRSFPGKPPKR